MGDSVQILSNTNNSDFSKRIHATRPPGRLHKGHNVTAATASIPSKYQTVVIDNSESKGFNSRSKRFAPDGPAGENPGPGTYVGHGHAETYAASFSKKGTGGFASKDRRLVRQNPPDGPGAGTYALPSLLRTVKDFNRGGATGAFHHPIAKQQDKKHPVPGPNIYDISKGATSIKKTNNVAANAAFKSQSKREVINASETANQPSPWQYAVKDDILKANVKVPVSSFKSKTKRQMQPSPPVVPGPGAYNPFDEPKPAQKTVFPRKHYLCISAPAMPLPKTPPHPGPGSYEIVNYEGPPKHYMSGAAFVSTTTRWSGGTGNDGKEMGQQPGPAHYRPSEVAKQSFIFNACNRWI